MASTASEGKTFASLKGFATSHGSMFEVNMAALLFLRGLNSDLDFHLATNVDGAGALDDIVLRVTEADRTSSTFFVQLKHKETPGISGTQDTQGTQGTQGTQEAKTTLGASSSRFKNMLVDPKNKKSPLQAYYKAYVELKNSIVNVKSSISNQSEREVIAPFYLEDVNLENCMFVFYTNAVPDEEFGTEVSSLSPNFKKIMQFLGNGSGKVLNFDLETDKDFLKCLSTEDPKDVAEFLSQFFVFCGQPSLGDCNDLIKKELQHTRDPKVREVDANRLSEHFVQVMKVWWEKSNHTLHKSSNILDTARVRIEVEDCSVLQKELYYSKNLCFTEIALGNLREKLVGSFTVLLVDASEDTFRLSYTKFCKATQQDSDLLMSLEVVLDNKDAVLSEFESGRVKRLVVCVRDLKTESPLYTGLFDLCTQVERSNGQLVIFSKDCEMLCNKLQEKFQKSKRVKDTFSFSEFTELYQREILEKEFLHQNSKTTFIKLLGNDRVNACHIDAWLAMQIIDFNAESLFAPVLEENISYFVDRTLDLNNVVKESYFQLHPIHANSIVENSSMQHVHSILLQGDPHVARQVHDTLHDHYRACVCPENEHPLLGEAFVVGKFKCNFIAVGQTKALQIRSVVDGIFSNIFVIGVSNQTDVNELASWNGSLHFFTRQSEIVHWVKSVSPIAGLMGHIDEEIATSSSTGVDNAESDRLGAESKSTDPKSTDPKSTESKSTDPKSTGPKSTDPKSTDPKSTDPKSTDPKSTDPKSTDPKSAGPKSTEPNSTEPKSTEPKSTDPKSTDPKSTDPKSTDPKSAGPTVTFMAKKRLAIVCGEPGMGKTTLMTHLALETKTLLSDFWIILISLNDHTDLFTAKGRLLYKDAHEYLLATAFQGQKGLQQALFKIALQKIGNVVVILDGYDEITPRYVTECHVLIKSLCETKARHIWVTSRNSMKSNLEEYMMTIAAKLREFNEDDQRKFLKLYWKSAHEKEKVEDPDLKILSGVDLELFITSLLAKTTQAISDQRNDFMSIPLQAQMVAEVFEDHVIYKHQPPAFNAEEKLDVLDLLHKFVEKKLHVYVQSRLHIKPFDTNYDTHSSIHKAEFKRNHSSAALVLILGAEDVERLHSKEIIRRSTKFLNRIIDGSDKSGFIDRVVNGNPRFIHRVYAEYFVAKWFAKKFAENVTFLRNDIYTENFKVVREIFDLLLARKCSSGLHLAVIKANAPRVQDLLENGSNVNEKDSGGRTALHLAATLHSRMRRDYENIKKSDADAILALLVARTTDFNQVDQILTGPPLLYARLTRSWDAMEALLINSSDKSCLNDEWDIENNEMLKTICTRDYAGLLEACLGQGLPVDHCFENNTESKSTQTLLLASGMAGSLKVAALLLNKGANILAVNEDGATALHLAARLGRMQLIRVLVNAACHSHDPPSVGLGDVNTSSFDEVSLGVVREIETARLINAVDKEGNTALHLFTPRKLEVQAPNDALEIVKLLVKAGASLGQENFKKETPLMLAAENHQENVVEYMLANIDSERKPALAGQTKDNDEKNDSVRFDFINKRDANGYNALHHAVVTMTKNRAGVVSCLIAHGADVRNIDAKGTTTLITAVVRYSGLGVVELLLGGVVEDKAGFVNTFDKAGNTAIHYSITTGQWDVFGCLAKAGGNFFLENSKGASSLNLAISTNFTEVVEHILTNFDDMRTRLQESGEVIGDDVPESKSDYVNKKDKRGCTVLNNAVKGGKEAIVSCLIKHGADVKIVDDNGLTPLCTVLKTGFFFDDIITILLDAVDEGSRADYVNTRGNDGCTALHHVSRLDTLELLVKAGGDLTLHEHEEGRTPFMAVAMDGKAEMVDYMLKNFVDSSVSGYMDSRNNEGLTVLHLAAFNGFVEVVRLLLGDKNANIWDVDDEFGGSSLHWAVKHPGVVRVLLDACGSDEMEKFVNFGDESGDTALHWAVEQEEENLESVRVLVEAGANVTLANNEGLTPLKAAFEKEGETEIYSFFNTLGYFYKES